MTGACSESLAPRNSAGYHPSFWGDYFIEHGRHVQESGGVNTEERIEELKEQVRILFEHSTDSLPQTMNLVNSIHLLGLAYHSEKEMDEALDRIYNADVDSRDLYETALWFRLLRQHGYHASSGVFSKFKNGGSFSSALKDDTKGLLSLYNAAFLGTHGDQTILDEAIVFAGSHLKASLAAGLLQEPLAAQASLALETPLPRRTRRLLSRKYISIYEQDAERDDAVLELAKLDFNRLQALHVEELREISIWWNDLALAKSLTFARDRVVECYYWVVAALHDPSYSRARMMTTKVMALLSITDDIYDNYSTIEESRLLTEAIERWEYEAVDLLPTYLKDFYVKLINSFEEFKTELAAEEKYRMFFLREEMKSLARNYYEEAKWGAEKYSPTVEEHLKLSTMTTAYRMISCACYVGMGNKVATKEALKWVTSFPKLVKASSLICRLRDDITSHELEQERDHVVSTVECHMKEHNTGVEEACEELQAMVEDAWKDLNEECLRPALPLPRALTEVVVDLARSMEETHKHVDTYTNSSTTMKDNITLLFAQPIPI